MSSSTEKVGRAGTVLADRLTNNLFHENKYKYIYFLSKL